MRISDWSSDVCSSDLEGRGPFYHLGRRTIEELVSGTLDDALGQHVALPVQREGEQDRTFLAACPGAIGIVLAALGPGPHEGRVILDRPRRPAEIGRAHV